MSGSTAEAVQTLFVTLRRSYAGTPWFHRRILEALGLKRRHQCVEKPNNSSMRGMLSKVPHMVTIETDRMRYLRTLKSYHEQLPRPPWVLQHDTFHLAALPSAHTTATAAIPPGAAPPALLPPPPAAPRMTPFVQAHLQEHLHPMGLDGFDALADRPKPPTADRLEAMRRWRVRVLTEHGIFSAQARKEHAEAVSGRGRGRRIGLRN